MMHKFAVIALLLAAGASAEPTSQPVFIDFECQGQRLSEVKIVIPPSEFSRILTVTLDHTACLPPGRGS